MEYKYYIIYKPYGFLSQFTSNHEHHHTLAELKDFPSDVYAVGRLDKDSEGLLLLTNDKKLNHFLLDPKFGHIRTYLAQVERIPSEEDLESLRKGVTIKVNKKAYQTKPCDIQLIPAPNLPERDPPIRYRKQIPTAWLEIKLAEGKNRQVRKMCAKIGFPVLRLVRIAMEDLNVHHFKIGQVEKLNRKELYALLKIN